MNEPSDEEQARAERIRKLRSGGARSRGEQMREHRREQADDGTGRPDETGEDGAASEAGGATAGDGTPTGADADDGDGAERDDAALGAGGADVMAMAGALPADGSLFVVPVHERLRREFNKVAEQLTLRYGFAYEHALDDETHVRPLALYLGVRALDDADVEAVRELLHSADVLAAPGDGD